jgi:hypothetical protein
MQKEFPDCLLIGVVVSSVNSAVTKEHPVTKMRVKERHYHVRNVGEKILELGGWQEDKSWSVQSALRQWSEVGSK